MNSTVGIERHLQTGIQVVIIGILIWFGNKTIATSDSVIRLEEQMIALRGDVIELSGELTSATANRYTSQDAAADKRFLNLQLDAIIRRLESCEKRIEELKP